MSHSPLRGRARRCALVSLATLSAPALALAQTPEPPLAEGPIAEGSIAETPVADGEGTAARPPAVEVQTLKRARHDWYAGFGVGLGVGNLRRDEAGSNAVSTALIGYLRGGGRIRDGLLVGGLAATTLGGARRGQGLFSAMGEVIGYPVKNRGLVLSAAVGIGAYVQTADATGGETMGTMATTSSQAIGAAFGLGLGYEFWLSRRFNLGLVARGDGLAMRKLGLRAAGTLGLSFSWY